MRTRLLKVLAAMGGVAAVWLLLGVKEQQWQSEEEALALRAELAELRVSVHGRASTQEASADDNQSLQAPLASPQRAVAQPRQETHPEEMAEAGGLGPEPEAQPSFTYEQSQARVLAAYSKEAIDPAWSRTAEGALDAAVGPHLPSGSSLRSIECRSTMCQLEVVHRDPKAQGSFLMEAFLGWPGSVFVAGERQEHDELQVTLIASRKGATLPLFPPSTEARKEQNR